MLTRLLPDEPNRVVFRVIPARLATGYYGAELQKPQLSFTARGVSLDVTRACGASDFFAMALGILAWGCVERRRKWGWLPVLPLAWCVTILANTARLIVLVPATEWMRAALPQNAHAMGHQVVGTAVFLLALVAVYALGVAALWAGTCRTKDKGLRTTDEGLRTEDEGLRISE